jgi:ABC-type taurine transport system ATPase subunit
VARLAFVSVSDGQLLSVTATFDPGRWVVLGTDPVALARLVELVAGARSPRRGAVLLDERRLDDQPLQRRRVATLLDDEVLPDASDVATSLRFALSARGDQRTPAELLSRFELGELRARPSYGLTPAERRAVALALALSHVQADVLALYEPLAAGARFGESRVLRALDEADARGAIVIACVRELSDAHRLGGTVLVLDQSGLVSLPSTAVAPAGVLVDLRAKSERARELVAALAADPAVSGVRFDDAREPGVLELSGSDADALALALARHAVERGVTLSEIRFGNPPLEALLAVRAAVARRYYEASYASVAPQPPAKASAPPPGAPAWAPYVAETQTAPRPPDQSVSMPTDFADRGGDKPGGGT